MPKPTPPVNLPDEGVENMDDELARIQKMESFDDEDDLGDPPRPPVDDPNKTPPPEATKTPEAKAPAGETPPAKPVEVKEPKEPAGDPPAPTPPEGTAKTPEAVKPPEPEPRPVRFIPMPKYHEEKKEWQSKLEDATAEIARLKSAAGVKPDTQKEEDAVNAYAEKWLMEPEQVRELLDIARAGNSVPPEVLKQMQETQAAKAQEEAKAKDAQHFNTEWEASIDPILKERYPNATPKGIAEARTRIDEIAHSSEALARTPLEYIFAKHEGELKEVLIPQTPRVGAERGRMTGGAAAQPVSASQFLPDKSGKFDFSSLNAMPDGAEKNKIISELNPHAHVAYVNQLEDDGLVVNRGGRQIKLK